MGLLVGVILILYAFIGYIIKRKIIAPIVLFNLLWAVVALLSWLRLYSFHETSDVVNWIILLGGTFFTLGTFVPAKVKLKGIHINRDNYEINYKLLVPVFMVAFVVLFIMFSSALRLLVSGVSFGQLRYLYGDQIQSNYFINVSYKFLAYPITIAIATLFLADFYVRKSINKKLLVMALALTVMDLIAVADRIIIIYYLIGAALLYLELSKKVSKKQKKKIRNIFFIAVGVFFVVLLLRGKMLNQILSSIYGYMIGPLPYFSNRIKDMTEVSPTYGVATMQGMIRPILGFLELFGIQWDLFEQATKFLLENQHIVVQVTADGKNFNYFCTAFAYFYRDGGMIGVGVLSFLFGLFCQKEYVKYRKIKDYSSVTGLIFVVVSIIMSFMSISFAETGMVWGFVFSKMMLQRKRNGCKQIE